MKDMERGTDGPGEMKFAVAADRTIREDAVCTLADPIDNVFAHVRPEEPEAEAVQGFVFTGVTGRWGSVISGEDDAAERGGYNNE